MPSHKPRRRQNASCDPCRRSKRRCSLLPIRDGTVCANCDRLGHLCTFNFVKSRSDSIPKRRQKKQNPIMDYEYDGENIFDNAAEALDNFPNDEFQLDVSASWLDFDIQHSYNDNVTCLPSSIDLPEASIPPRLDTATAAGAQYEPQVSPLPGNSHTAQYPQPNEVLPVSVGGSLSSPIYLLNSKLEATILDERLARIYDTIVTGCASRFVDYHCNSYATGYPNELENRDHGLPGDLMSDGLNTVPRTVLDCSLSASQPQISSSDPGRLCGRPVESGMASQILATQGIGCGMTLLGAVRFLDHFSSLYGNRLTLVARKQSDATLKAVLRAFSLQWLPSPDLPFEARSTADDNIVAENLDGKRAASNSNPNPFVDAWFRARLFIEDAQSVRSFHVVFAILMFEGIAVPTEASSGVAHEFLDVGLQKLCELDSLVKQYRTNLGPSSKYGALVEASLSVIRWCGYIRDTGTALTTNYQCKLPDLSSHAKGKLTYISQAVIGWAELRSHEQAGFFSDQSISDWSTHRNFHNLDRSVPDICRRAAADAFSIWRQIINVKNAPSKPTDNVIALPSNIFEAISSTVTAVDKFTQLFRPFMDHCIEHFEYLSTASTISFVSLVTFWDLGVLILAESLKPFMNELGYHFEPHLTQRIQAYQREAISSVARTMECVLTFPIEEAVNLQNGLGAEVPIIAYHITPSLMVTTLQKAVENAIDLQFSPHCGSLGAPEGRMQDPVLESSWARQIDFLMKGLTSLDVTIGGSQTAGVAIQLLMRKYGDILSECWSCDF